MAKNTALQWIIKEAKALKKKYPRRFNKWTDYVAQASAIYARKHSGKSPVGKKKVGATKFIEKGETARTPGKVYKRIRDNKGHFKSVRIAGVKTVSRSHTDKNRITANIQVGSLNQENVKQLAVLTQKLASAQKQILHFKMIHRHATGEFKRKTAESLKGWQNQVNQLKKQISLVKQNIK